MRRDGRMALGVALCWVLLSGSAQLNWGCSNSPRLTPETVADDIRTGSNVIRSACLVYDTFPAKDRTPELDATCRVYLEVTDAPVSGDSGQPHEATISQGAENGEGNGVRSLGGTGGT